MLCIWKVWRPGSGAVKPLPHSFSETATVCASAGLDLPKATRRPRRRRRERRPPRRAPPRRAACASARAARRGPPARRPSRGRTRRRSCRFGGRSDGLAAGRLGRRGPHAPYEQRHHHGEVADVGDDLEPGHRRRQVEHALHEGAVPGAGVDALAQVDGVRGLAGQHPAFLEVAQPVAEDSGRDDDEDGAGGGEELREVDLQTRRYRPQHSTEAMTMPMPAPIIGPADSPAARAVVHRNSAVSRPSRPTARNEVTTACRRPWRAPR